MFVRKTLSLLAGVHQAAVTDPVDAPWDPRGLAEDLVHDLIGKDILPALPDEHECHRAHRIEFIIQQEAEFLNGLFFQKVCFIQNADDFPALHAADDLHLLLELPLSIAAVEL